MKMIGENREPRKINSKAGSEAFQEIFDPRLAVIIVLPGDGIATEQKTAKDDSIHHRDDRNFVRAKNLHARSTSHRKAPDANPNQRLKIDPGDSSKPACLQKCCDPCPTLMHHFDSTDERAQK